MTDSELSKISTVLATAAPGMIITVKKETAEETDDNLYVTFTGTDEELSRISAIVKRIKGEA